MLNKAVVPILLLILVPSAYASTYSNVKVYNSVGSNTNSTSQVTTKTNITTETNGQVTHYESDQPGDVEVKSENGNSTIKVNGQEVSTTQTKNQSPTPSSISPENKESTSEERKQLNDFRKIILEQFKRPFRIFRALFFFW